MIRFEKFTKKFPSTLAVSQLSLTVQKGETVGFIGKNGAGKSTTIRCLLGFITPTLGKIYVDDLDVTKNIDYVKKICSYLPSEPSFPPHQIGRAHV